MKTIMTLAAMALGLLFCTPSMLRSQSKDQVQEWMKSAMPGEHHKLLEPLVGKWNLEIDFGPGQGKSKGTSEFRWAMGKRFVIEETKTETGGQAFEWMAIHGYDNHAKQFVFASIDTFGTAIDQMIGQCDAAGKTITYVGELADGRGGKAHTKWVVQIEGKDAMRVEMFEPGSDGAQSKVMEIIGKRAS